MKPSLIIQFFTLLLVSATSANAQQTNYKFDFGPGKAEKGYTKVTGSDTYTAAKGWGFDFDSKVTEVNNDAKNALLGDLVKSTAPFYFSVKLPEGNYKVTVTLGDSKAPSLTTVKAESRRLMLENIKTETGKMVTKTFIVNIKDRKIDVNTVVGLKPRELTKLDWDDKMTLEFDLQTALVALEITKVENQVTVFLAGNSTVVNQDSEPWASWGQMFPRFFKPGVAIANHAESGLTLGSFIGSRRLNKILSVMKPGDYLFVEFGHNDQKDKGPNDGAYKSYSERLRFFITETRKKGGIPVIVTSTSRRSFDADGKIQNSLGDFPDAARKVAASENVALIDLNVKTAELFNALGVETSKKAFVHYPANSYPGQETALADNTHFNPYGAYEIAKCVVLGIQEQKLGLAKFLVTDLPPFNPAQPDDVNVWRWPESLRSSVIKPDGN